MAATNAFTKSTRPPTAGVHRLEFLEVIEKPVDAAAPRSALSKPR